MALEWAQLSHCERKKVGALIVKDRMIISDGFNGTPTGFENPCEDEQNYTKWYGYMQRRMQSQKWQAVQQVHMALRCTSRLARARNAVSSFIRWVLKKSSTFTNTKTAAVLIS